MNGTLCTVKNFADFQVPSQVKNYKAINCTAQSKENEKLINYALIYKELPCGGSAQFRLKITQK